MTDELGHLHPTYRPYALLPNDERSNGSAMIGGSGMSARTGSSPASRICSRIHHGIACRRS
jgi:hypothetical protein